MTEQLCCRNSFSIMVKKMDIQKNRSQDFFDKYIKGVDLCSPFPDFSSFRIKYLNMLREVISK
jgi:hypothetical protein